MPHRIDATMDAMQSSGGDPAGDSARTEAGADKLRT